MKPFLLRVSKAHFLINLQLYQTIYNWCRIPPYSNSPNLQMGWDTHGFKSLPGFFGVLLRMTVHVSMVYDQTIDGRRNREQIWGSYFVIEMIKLSYSRVDTDVLMEVAYSCKFLAVSDSSTCPDIGTSWCHAGIIEHFEIRGFKMTP